MSSTDLLTTSPITAPYGSWHSPISADLLISQTVRLAEPCIDGSDTYWLESRPQEKGRNTIMQRNGSGEVRELLPRPLNVRSRAHEYGGGHYTVVQGIVYFVLFDDQRVYRLDSLDPKAIPEPLSPEGPFRYADFCIDQQRQQLIAIREDHSDSSQEERNSIVSIALDGSQAVKELTGGHDFYSNPRLSPNGQQLSYLCWDHPNMPWDSTECWLASLDQDGNITDEEKIAGNKGESLFQPQWSPAGDLYLVSDRSQWWNLYRYADRQLVPLIEMAAEFATPQWVFGMSTYGFLDHNSLICCFTQNGQWQLGEINLAEQQLNTINTSFSEISALAASQGRAVFLGASATRFNEVINYQQQKFSSLASSSGAEIDKDNIALPEAISFNTPDGEQAHAFYYPPTNKDYRAAEGELPPLITFCHGGPTGATETALNLKIQFWTSRGFAILDINYRGSTGYGRAYRERLKNNWGISDVIDVCAGAEYLVEQQRVNPKQLAIKGGSAGGYTVLAALAFANTFHAGASHYGIGDLETLARDTHKFEARYLDSLVGPYPETKNLYQQRSPINHVEQLNCPVIFFQGLDDKVVPPNQAEAMVQALKDKKIPTAYVPFEGEGHGFRQGPNIKRALEAELYFYGKLFNFEPAEAIEAVAIYNLNNKTADN